MLVCLLTAHRKFLQEMLLRVQAFHLCFRQQLAWLMCKFSSVWSVSVKVSVFCSCSFMSFRHQREADVMQQSSSDALNKSEKSLALVKALMSNENKVKELIGDLKNT